MNGFIFDLDGTLVYVPKYYSKWAVNRTLELLKAKPAPERECIEFWYALKPRDIVIRESFNVDVNEFWETFRQEVDVDRKKYVRAYEDVEVIDQLKNNGKHVALITGAPKRILAIEYPLLNTSFEFVMMANHISQFPEKPHPIALLAGISRFGLPKQEVCYIGNSEEDILFARNAGVKSIIIERDIGYKLYSDKTEPELVIHSLTELLDL